MSTYLHANKRLSQICFFYANIIGYIRLILISVSIFAVHVATTYDSFSWAIFAFCCNYTGGWLLDWVDGPVARKYKQCTIFGATFDWYCDLLAELVYILWAAELRLWLAPWILIIFALALCSAFVDTTNVATGYRWREITPTHGIPFRILNIVYPNGHYNKWGTTLWIVYATWISCQLLLAHTPADYIYFATFLHGSSLVLSPGIIGYILHQFAYLFVLVSGWKEPSHGFIE